MSAADSRSEWFGGESERFRHARLAMVCSGCRRGGDAGVVGGSSGSAAGSRRRAGRLLFAVGGWFSDLTPLAGLTKVTNLHLYRNNIADLEPVRNLTRLRFLDLRDNHITSLEPLRGLTSLEDLYIADNRITDFTPIDTIAGLTIHGSDDQDTPN